MFDTLPFPNMTAKDAEDRSRQTIDYLLQFREELVFILDSIVNGEYGKLMTPTVQTNVAEKIMTASADTLTVAEVINSAAFKSALTGVKDETFDEIPGEVADQISKIHFTVNFESGELEYTLT